MWGVPSEQGVSPCFLRGEGEPPAGKDAGVGHSLKSASPGTGGGFPPSKLAERAGCPCPQGSVHAESPPKLRGNETHPGEGEVGQEEQFRASVAAAVSSEDFAGKKVPLCPC